MDQYVWAIPISAAAFVLSSIYLVYKIPHYARWSVGYTDEIVRSVRDSKSDRDYLVRGGENTPLKDALHDSWPFKKRNRSGNWYAVDESGNDVTNQPLGLLDGTVVIHFLEED
jgi:hypothetical protein